MPAYSSSCPKVGRDAQGSTQRQSPSCSQRPFQKLPNEPLTAVSISVDPILVFGDETLLEGPKDQGARRGGPRGAQRRGGQHLLDLGTYHQTLAQAASRDGGVEAKSIPPRRPRSKGAARSVAAIAPRKEPRPHASGAPRGLRGGPRGHERLGVDGRPGDRAPGRGQVDAQKSPH
jgi:hypothetical protein